MKIIITGASGFFGRSVIESLRTSKKNFQVYCVYNSKSFEISDNRFTWIQCDLLDKHKSINLLDKIKPTHFIHLAWYVVPNKFWTSTENLTWVDASVELFKAFAMNGGQTFVCAGTLAEYDWSTGFLDEISTNLNPNSLYGQSKKILLEKIFSFRDNHFKNINIVWPRIGYFFGQYEPKEKLISSCILNIINQISLQLTNKDFKRPYAHVKYFGKIISELLFRFNQDFVFNCSASISYSTETIINFMIKVIGEIDVKTEYGVYNSTPLVLKVNTSYLKNKIQWEIPDTFFSDLKVLLIEKYLRHNLTH